MPSVDVRTTDPDETRALGRAIGTACRGGETLLLHGALGAGKTCFMQGFARGVGVPEEEPVVSPTFVLHVQYDGRLELNHLDAYRLAAARDTGHLGLEEMYADTRAVTAVEWAEYLGACIPAERLEVTITVDDDGSRCFHFESVARVYGRHMHLLDAARGAAGAGA